MFPLTDVSEGQFGHLAHNCAFTQQYCTKTMMSDYAALLPPTWRSDVERWLQEDLPSFDIGGFVVGEKEEVAHLFCKSDGVLAGMPFATGVFELLNCSITWHVAEGTYLDTATQSANGKVHVATVRGKAKDVLMAERTALNILARASGIASKARAAVEIADAHNWHGVVAGTRKTTPGFRMVEKYSLIVGGSATHRYDLSQMVMLKDNHIWSAGSITAAVKKARTAAGFSMKIEVECNSLQEGVEAAAAGADIVMLDNFSPEALKVAAAELKAQFPSLLIEASGGITQETMHEFMSPHVDIISRGTLTQGYSIVDYSLKIQAERV